VSALASHGQCRRRLGDFRHLRGAVSNAGEPMSCGRTARSFTAEAASVAATQFCLTKPILACHVPAKTRSMAFLSCYCFGWYATQSTHILESQLMIWHPQFGRSFIPCAGERLAGFLAPLIRRRHFFSLQRNERHLRLLASFGSPGSPVGDDRRSYSDVGTSRWRIANAQGVFSLGSLQSYFRLAA
jgi:hypothetical protein